MLWKDQNFASITTALTPRLRAVYVALAIGSIFPIFFLGIAGSALWLAAFQLACATGLAYIRWRTSALRGSLVVVVAAAVACLVSVAAAVAA